MRLLSSRAVPRRLSRALCPRNKSIFARALRHIVRRARERYIYRKLKGRERKREETGFLFAQSAAAAATVAINLARAPALVALCFLMASFGSSVCKGASMQERQCGGDFRRLMCARVLLIEFEEGPR